MRAALVAIAAVAALPSNANAAAPCGIRGARVVAHGTHVTVLKRSTHYWACLSASGFKRRLDHLDDVVGHFRVSGRFLAYERDDDCFSGCRRMVALDVRSGRKLVSYVGYGHDGVPPPRGIVLDARGRLAWVRDQATRELHRMDGDGDEIVDTGPEIDPRSLTITGDRLVWRHGAEERSAPLDAHPPCAARNSATLERTADVRLYWRPTRSVLDTGYVYGCALETGRVTRMGERRLDDLEYYGGGHVHAAGRFATIETGWSGRSGAHAELSVYDLVQGVRVHHWECCRTGDALTHAVVLHPSGAVAWMWGQSPYGSMPKPTSSVSKSDATAEAVTLATSHEWKLSDRESLRLDGDVVSWTLNGVPGTAELR